MPFYIIGDDSKVIHNNMMEINSDDFNDSESAKGYFLNKYPDLMVLKEKWLALFIGYANGNYFGNWRIHSGNSNLTWYNFPGNI